MTSSHTQVILFHIVELWQLCVKCTSRNKRRMLLCKQRATICSSVQAVFSIMQENGKTCFAVIQIMHEAV